MAGPHYCVYNQTRECFLGLHVSAADESPTALAGRLEGLTLRADEGLWLTPSRGLPASRELAAFDLLCLDQEQTVLAGLDSWSGQPIPRSYEKASSLLLLARNSIYSSNTQPGDQLLICPANQLGQKLHRTTSAQSDESAAMQESLLSWPFLPDNPEPASGDEGEVPLWTARDRRCAPRQPAAELDAGFWYGASPQSRAIRDISASGLYLITQEQWYPGTIVRLALRTRDVTWQDQAQALSILTRVTRWGRDGVGLQFLAPDSEKTLSGNLAASPLADATRLNHFLDLLRSRGGHILE